MEVEMADPESDEIPNTIPELRAMCLRLKEENELYKENYKTVYRHGEKSKNCFGCVQKI